MRLIVLLDANVLYPAPLRDYLLNLAALGLFEPKWTDKIQDEWIRSLLLKRQDLKLQDMDKTCRAMNSAFPHANVSNYQQLINGLILPDADDRHILAAAIQSNAEVIVTCNIKDFPAHNLKSYDIVAQHPDEFIVDLIKEDRLAALEALHNQVMRLKNPPLSVEEVLAALKKCGLKNSVALLK